MVKTAQTQCVPNRPTQSTKFFWGATVKLKTIVLALALTSLTAVNASADTFTVNATGPSGILTGTYSGSFDLSSVMAASGYTLPYQITSANLRLNFVDVGSGSYINQPSVYLGTTSGQYYLNDYGDNGSYEYYDYRRAKTVSYSQNSIQQVASALLTIGGNEVGSAQGTVSFVGSAQINTSGGAQYDDSTYYEGYYYRCGNFRTCYAQPSYYSYYSDVTNNTTVSNYSSAGSAFSISSDLTQNQSFLNQLSSTGSLLFDLDVANQANLDSATLQVVAVPVPGPESYLMMTLGLSLGVALARRRQRSLS
jgi:hypothetical protein